MIKNKGNTQTTIYNNNVKYNVNKIKWDASYDGEVANINMDINENGNKKHFNMNLDNEDLAELLNVPSVDEDLYRRLKKDFKNVKPSSTANPFIIELDKNNITPENNITSFHNNIMKKYNMNNINNMNKYSRKFLKKNRRPRTSRIYFKKKMNEI